MKKLLFEARETIELQEQLMQTIMELHPHKVTKGLVEKPTARQSILTAKGRIEKDTLLAEIEQKLDVGINVSVEGITIANHKFKKVTQRKLEKTEAKSNLLTRPSLSNILKDDVSIVDKIMLSASVKNLSLDEAGTYTLNGSRYENFTSPLPKSES